MTFAMQTVTGSCFAARPLLCRKPSPRYAQLDFLATWDIASWKIVINCFSLALPVRGAIRTLSCTRSFFFCLVYGLEPKWHQLTSHCLLRKRTVKGRLGVVQAEFTLVVLIACGISSLRPIPPRRYARVTGLSSLRGAIRTLSCTRFFFFCLVFYLEDVCFIQAYKNNDHNYELRAFSYKQRHIVCVNSINSKKKLIDQIELFLKNYVYPYFKDR